MLGIVLKDFYECFCIKKNLLGIIFGFSILVILTLFSPNVYTLALLVSVSIPFVSSSPLQYSMEQDEISKFDDILLTYLLTKNEIVLAKYLSCLIFTFCSWLISLIIVLFSVYMMHVCDLSTGLLLLCIGMILSLVLLAVNCIGFFLLGNKKGTIAYIIVLVLAAFSYVIIYFNVDFTPLLNLGLPLLLGITFLISAALLGLSYLGSVKVYTRKHS